MSKERKTTVSLFPVDNGDMTLIALADNLDTKVLIDCNIRASADDPEDVTRDVAKDLRDRLKRDSKGRPYIKRRTAKSAFSFERYGLRPSCSAVPAG